MRILPQNINQTTQLHNKKNDVKFGMKLTPKYAASLIEEILIHKPAASDSLSWMRHGEERFSYISRLISACKRHEKKYPGSKLVLDGGKYIEKDFEPVYVPTIHNATQQEIEALSFPNLFCRDDGLEPVKLAEKLEQFCGVEPNDRLPTYVNNYDSAANKLLRDIYNLTVLSIV